MTPQYILQKSLCRPPSCGSSHLKNEEELKAYNLRVAQCEIDGLGYAKEYAEPGYTDPAKGILFANWNYFPRGVADILENYGYEIEWSDEWDFCSDCNKAFRTSGNSYSWQPSYADLDGSRICIECLQQDPTEYLESLEDNPRRALNIDGIDPADYGYTMLEGEYENGWHPGQNDDPKAIYKNLRAEGFKKPLLFQIDSVGQFDISFVVWQRDATDDSAEYIEPAEQPSPLTSSSASIPQHWMRLHPHMRMDPQFWIKVNDLVVLNSIDPKDDEAIKRIIEQVEGKRLY